MLIMYKAQDSDYLAAQDLPYWYTKRDVVVVVFMLMIRGLWTSHTQLMLVIFCLHVYWCLYFRQREQKLDCPWNWSTRPQGKTLIPTMFNSGQLCLYWLLMWVTAVVGDRNFPPSTLDWLHPFICAFIPPLPLLCKVSQFSWKWK